tara:strand:+ start:2346 stop:2942 length:597 start_codon:yes stop_codon:yes gene_type:complete
MTYDINTLHLLKYVEIAKNNSLDLLLKQRPRNKYIRNAYIKLFKIDLQAVWEKLSEDYAKEENDDKTAKVKQLEVKLRKLEFRYSAIVSCLEVLRYKKDDEMVSLLKEYGYEIVGEYWKGLEIVFKQVENLNNQIKAVKKEITGLLNHGKSDKEVSIYEIITNLSLGLDTTIDIDKLKVIQYIYYKKALVKKIKQNSK